MAGALFGEVELSLFVTGAIFCDIYRMIAGARHVVFFNIQNARGEREKQPRLRGGLRTDGFMVGTVSDGRIGRAA